MEKTGGKEQNWKDEIERQGIGKKDIEM